jgi:protein-disulfide isomerase-like protein with CxxC motif
MKVITAAALMTMGLAAGLMAETFTGVVMDQKCSGVAGMKENTACIQKCIKGGSPAVLVAPDGKVYKIANQDKILPSAGKNVSVDGKLDGETITVASVK